MTPEIPVSITPHLPNGLSTVEQDIARACEHARRDRSSVTLIAVSKTFDAAAIAPVTAAGQRGCREKYGLPISGLMCIPPVDDAPAPHFALTAKIAERNGLKGLSMGMSADFAIAIQFGATHVRVGSAIFGHR